MAQLTKDDVLKLARLARLNLTEDEIAHFQNEIESILQYVEKLNEADLEGIVPTYQVSGQSNIVREDVVRPGIATPQQLLKNAPALENGQIKVRRMIG